MRLSQRTVELDGDDYTHGGVALQVLLVWAAVAADGDDGRRVDAVDVLDGCVLGAAEGLRDRVDGDGSAWEAD